MVLPDSFHRDAWTHRCSTLGGIFQRRMITKHPLAQQLTGEDLFWPQQGPARCSEPGCLVGLSDHVTNAKICIDIVKVSVR